MNSTEITVSSRPGEIAPGDFGLGGKNPSGETIGFTNSYMTLDGRPFFGICGEFHYSRCARQRWEDEIVKMKTGGVNILSTYIIWIHHEEEEGVFDWSGDRDLRGFVLLCAKHGMKVILRVGPFCHGEVRNGGFPDWLYGRPFEVRSNDERYLRYVRRLYGEIGGQVRDLMYGEGGPVVGIQLENEYMAAAAPWELTPPQITEWMTGGTGGEEHLEILKKLAEEAGLEAPIYTCTGWGDAPVPKSGMLPLYGAYAYCPWLFYQPIDAHPATDSTLFRDFHNDAAVTPGFAPPYPKSRYPYACCEMGGGMQVWYDYRFTVPPESVEAMTLAKIGSGCNFVGYYMFHGGSNPVGKHAYLNEHTCPKISYDFQAPLGEYGQVRESYRRLKRLFLFLRQEQDQFCRMRTFLPEGAETIAPEDTHTLRCAVRAEGGSGYLFLNNVQDHAQTQDLDGCSVRLHLPEETLTIPRSGAFTLKKDVCCILPFNLLLSGALLKYAAAQMITAVEEDGVQTVFFYIPDGLDGEFCFDADTVRGVDAFQVEQDGATITVHADPFPDASSCFTLETQSGQTVRIVTMLPSCSLDLWKITLAGRERVVLTDVNLLADAEGFRLESEGNAKIRLAVYPESDLNIDAALRGAGLKPRSRSMRCGRLFTVHEAEFAPKRVTPETELAGTRAVVRLPEGAFEGLKDILLRVHYAGDVAYAFLGGHLVADNFCNGNPWEIALRGFETRLSGSELDLALSPLKKDSRVQSDSLMAARVEITGEQVGAFQKIEAVPVYEVRLSF